MVFSGSVKNVCSLILCELNKHVWKLNHLYCHYIGLLITNYMGNDIGIFGQTGSILISVKQIKDKSAVYKSQTVIAVKV